MKITETTPQPVTRTFVLELTADEVAVLASTLGKASTRDAKDYLARYNERVGQEYGAAFLAGEGPDLAYRLYDDLDNALQRGAQR